MAFSRMLTKNCSWFLALAMLLTLLSVCLAPQARADEDTLETLSKRFRDVAEKVQPAVVNVESVQVLKGRGSRGMDTLPEDHPFRDFFGDEFFRRFFGPMAPEGRGRFTMGVGSGVIVDEKGTVLTNYHVVRGADVVNVKLADKREFEAEVVGVDEKTEVAVLRIEGDHFTPATLGDSDKAEVGDWVLAIGNPFGLSQTVTAGIVSAKGRANVGIADYEDFIQTDAAINPGNSGGPLVNMNGEVIGINTAIVSGSRSNAGVGFAIPSNMAKAVMEELINEGKVTRGHLGVWIQDLNEDLAGKFGISEIKGALVSDVIEDSPAEKAGIQTGDVIVRYNDREVEDASRLRNMVAATAPETKVELEIIREGESKTISVVIGTQPGESLSEVKKTELGLSVDDLTPEVAKELGVEKAEGVVVTEVEPGGPAEEAGVRRGDVIVELDRQAVKNVEEFNEALAKSEEETNVLLLVRRGKQSRYFAVPMK
jgi:serine protease Do